VHHVGHTVDPTVSGDSLAAFWKVLSASALRFPPIFPMDLFFTPSAFGSSTAAGGGAGGGGGEGGEGAGLRPPIFPIARFTAGGLTVEAEIRQS
jgi:hypothetical protein